MSFLDSPDFILQKRISAPDGRQIFRRIDTVDPDRKNDEIPYKLALEVITEAMGKNADEKISGTTFTVRQALEDNNILGQIVFLRRTNEITSE